jgi:maltooligosyltrehalose trehalohydrolase
MLAWYRALTALRRQEPDLRDDDLREVRVETGPARLTMHRGAVDVHVNIGSAVERFSVPAGAEVVLAWDPVRITSGTLDLAPDGVAIVRARRPG